MKIPTADRAPRSLRALRPYPGFFLLPTLLLTLTGCPRYFVLQAVETEVQSASAPFVIAVANRLDRRLVVEPTDEGRPPIEIAPGETADVATLSISRIRLAVGTHGADGEASEQATAVVHQALDGPYLDVGEAGRPTINLFSDADDCPGCLACSFRIHAAHDAWFSAQVVRVRDQPSPNRLTVCIDACRDGRLTFVEGPATNECSD